MAYRVFFSGLMVFVRYKGYEQVDVLLLNPCAEHHGHAGEKHAHSESHDEASCTDRHLPQLTIKASDMATWNLAGTLHGCGSRHFDLTGKTVFNDVQVPNNDRQIQVPNPDPENVSVRYSVDPFGDMRHVSFKTCVVDLCKVLGDGKGKIDHPKVTEMLTNIGTSLIAARVRLPAGELTALAPLDNSARQIVKWRVGNQPLDVMAETVMFEPANRNDNRITLGGDEYVTLRSKPDVTVWITAEPRRRTRADPRDMKGAQHFEHYYELLPKGHGDLLDKGGRVVTDAKGHVKKLVPFLDHASFNTDTPPCPGTQGCTDPPLP